MNDHIRLSKHRALYTGSKTSTDQLKVKGMNDRTTLRLLFARDPRSSTRATYSPLHPSPTICPLPDTDRLCSTYPRTEGTTDTSKAVLCTISTF